MSLELRFAITLHFCLVGPQMARLEFVHYEFFDMSPCEHAEPVWGKEKRAPIERLPQIFWEDGRGWDEANVWALDRAASREIDMETVKRTMKHLCRYATFLEARDLDWRHFPVRLENQVLRMFRKRLMDDVGGGLLAISTASNCINAVIQFYRFADKHNLVGADNPMWIDRLVTIPFFDATGFKRAMVRLTTDLSISNRRRIGVQLEGGLLPLRAEHMKALLTYTAAKESDELHLMLSVGFFTGARLGTVTTLTVSCLQTAREDPVAPGIYLLPVGPGTGVATKFSINGDIMVPKAVLDDLKAYAVSTGRLLMEAKAKRVDKNRLFLTRRARPYSVGTVNRLIQDMRERAVAAGLEFMPRFYFHQSRATFGTWLMHLLLDSGAKSSSAIAFVKDAMLHKDESTAWRYIAFLEHTQAKEEMATAFNEAFTGLRSRDWNDADA
ncbi:tyrosine-type recombinase/integrase [Burkholderia ubonensis]|uniref:tyrosine-type recombinase/integrase n=1 Tax=Burkholderia ubonensis TaxID=101571 RepID=UPI001E56ACF6|nr:site-specific integrase [Burkholderia ubonensis]